VAKQHLNHTNIDILLQKMGGKAVPKRVQGDPLADLRHMGCCMADTVQLARGHGVDRVLTRKQPSRGLADAPPLPQNIEQHGGKHGVTVLASLALLDAEHHAGAVDVRNLQRYHFGSPEPRAIGNAQRRLVLGAGSAFEEAGDFLLGQHRGQLLGALHPEQRLQKPGLVKRHAEEEPQRLHRRVDAGNAQ